MAREREKTNNNKTRKDKKRGLFNVWRANGQNQQISVLETDQRLAASARVASQETMGTK